MADQEITSTTTATESEDIQLWGNTTTGSQTDIANARVVPPALVSQLGTSTRYVTDTSIVDQGNPATEGSIAWHIAQINAEPLVENVPSAIATSNR